MQFTSSEVSALWQTIIANQSHVCLLEQNLSHIDDLEIKAALRELKSAAEEFSNRGLSLYTGAGYPEPLGFHTKNDVNKEALRLYSDRFYLVYNQIMCEYGLTWYSLCLGKTTNKAVISFLSNCIVKTIGLYTSITDLMERKGFGHPPVYMIPPEESEPSEKQSFIKEIFGNQRPLNATEIDNLVFSLRGAIVAKPKFMALSQTSSDREVREFCFNGAKICNDRIIMMQSLLAHENLPFQPTYDTDVTDSTKSPFSDRLIMYHILFIVQVALVRYGTAFSLSARKDLAAMYTKLEVETATIAEKGLQIMLEKGWLEHPPYAIDREKLSERS